jgi:cytochrome c-type protein NapB
MNACAYPNVRAIARTAVLAAAVLVVLGVAPVRPALAAPAGAIDAMRGPTPLDEEGRPPPLGNAENKDVRRNRAFPMQPPTIPHKIDGYQVDRNTNRCMSCHSRMRIEETRAIPIPATHYMDRDGTLLGDVSTRRYFCTQCHVTQDEVKPLVDNLYQDFDAVRSTPKTGAAAGAAKKR